MITMVWPCERNGYIKDSEKGLENVGALTSHYPMSLHSLLQGPFTEKGTGIKILRKEACKRTQNKWVSQVLEDSKKRGESRQEIKKEGL
jgi:hypothetical protein